MRLYDSILATRGAMLDQLVGGAITDFCKDLEQAQCFNLSEPIANICAEVSRSKPSSILSALDMIRAPFPLTWIEWGTARPYSVANDKPIPKRLGCLLKTNAAGSKGIFAFAWVHGEPDPGITVNPLGLIFDWDSASTDPVIVQYGESRGMREQAARAAEAKRELYANRPIKAGSRWARFSQVPKERAAVLELEMRAEMMPLDAFTPFMVQAGIVPGHPIYENYASDLAGEMAFLEAFLLLLNSRNSIVEQTRDDFSKLNRARAKNRKPPLKEFVTTSIKLNKVQSNRLGGTAEERAAARAHMVRGHFKIKHGNCWWWSPHARGHGTIVKREYKVS